MSQRKPEASGNVVMVMDVGNTHAVCGLYRGDELVEDLRLATRSERTADEYGALLLPLLRRAGLEPGQVEGVAIASVVPPLHDTLELLARRYFDCEPLFVQPGIKTGLSIRYDNPAEVGADRIANAVAVRELYGSPSVVVDFGTATTFDVLNRAGEYVGGIIAPGLTISAEALFSHASRLYRVDLRRPDELVGRNTAGAMQSGIYYGYLSLVDGILERLLDAEPELRIVVATGGQATLIAQASRYIQRIDPHLTLTGLKLVYDRNR